VYGSLPRGLWRGMARGNSGESEYDVLGQRGRRTSRCPNARNEREPSGGQLPLRMAGDRMSTAGEDDWEN